jgi:rhomboid protease GluP
MTDKYSQTTPPVSSTPTRIPVKFRTAAQKPMVTYVLMGLTIAVFGLQYLSQNLSPNHYDWPYLLGAKVNELILAGQVWRLITPVLLHASLIHIGFNMYALFVIGPSLERYYGHWRYLLLYLIGGFTGNVLSFVLSPNPSIGASTAVFGLVAAEAVFILVNRKLFGSRARGMLMNLGLVIIVNLALGLSSSGIDNWGHLGGLAGGAIFAWLAGPVFKMSISTDSINYELVDSRTNKEVLWGTLLSAGLFLAVVIGRFLAG